MVRIYIRISHLENIPVGGGVITKFDVIDLDAPELEKKLMEASDVKLIQVVGAEVIEPKERR